MEMHEMHLAELLLEYVLSTGVKKLNELPGIWEHKVDDQWTIKCNGHPFHLENIPAFSWAFEYNGWPAGIMGIMGDGCICAGDHGNEENLKKVLIEKLNAASIQMLATMNEALKNNL